MNAEELRQSLAALGLSQGDLGKLVDVSARGVNLWATGERSVPGPVVAYLRLLASLPANFRDAELVRLKQEKVVMQEGMYGIEFVGAKGSGLGVLVFEDGKIYGADVGNGIYDGTYVSGDAGTIRAKIAVTLPPGSMPVQTGAPLPVTIKLNVECEFPRGAQDVTVSVQTELGPVNARFRYMRPLPN